MGGSLPAELAALPLKYVYMDGNNFVAAFPDGWEHLSQISALSSFFTGPLPARLLASPQVESM